MTWNISTLQKGIQTNILEGVNSAETSPFLPGFDPTQKDLSASLDLQGSLVFLCLMVLNRVFFSTKKKTLPKVC